MNKLDKDTVITFDNQAVLSIDGVNFEVTKEGINNLITFINRVGGDTIRLIACSRRWNKEAEKVIRGLIAEHKQYTYRDIAKKCGMKSPQSAKYYWDKVLKMTIQEGNNGGKN